MKQIITGEYFLIIKKVTTSKTSVNTTGRESLDIEVSKKIALTIGGLIGAYTKSAGSSSR